MSFQVGIRALGGAVVFQLGLCTPLRTMKLIDLAATSKLNLCCFHIPNWLVHVID